MENILVRTKTGNKVHSGRSGCCMTDCGIRFAMRINVKKLTSASASVLCERCINPVWTEIAKAISQAFYFGR